MTRILHVWDQAGVACTLAKYQRKLGHNADVIKRDGFDTFGIMDFYGEKTFKTLIGRGFLKLAMKYAENYEIIHIHDLIKLVPLIRKKYPDKTIILHYHGSLLRNTSADKRFDAESKVDKILVSTPDLTKFVDGTYLHNPVDIEHFSPRPVKENNLALSSMTLDENEQVLTKLLKSNEISLKLEAMSRKEKPVPYSNMPNSLANYEYLVDLKLVYNNNPMPAYGLLGLQALSIGLKVINHEYKITQGLPQEHYPDKVVEKLMKIYEH